MKENASPTLLLIVLVAVALSHAISPSSVLAQSRTPGTAGPAGATGATGAAGSPTALLPLTGTGLTFSGTEGDGGTAVLQHAGAGNAAAVAGLTRTATGFYQLDAGLILTADPRIETAGALTAGQLNFGTGDSYISKNASGDWLIRGDGFNVLNIPFATGKVTSGYGFISNVGSGSTAYGVAVTGAQIDFGPGASDYCYSNGTSTITCAATLGASFLIGSGSVTAGTSGGFAIGANSILFDMQAYGGSFPNTLSQNGTIGLRSQVPAGTNRTGTTIASVNSLCAQSGARIVTNYCDSNITERSTVEAVSGYYAVNPQDGGSNEYTPTIRGNVTTPQIFEVGTSTFVAGSKAITFNTPFKTATVPICTCSDNGGSALACAHGTCTAAGCTFYGTVTDNFDWFCLGQR